jgi:hexulose-6-phosphate isomerase
MYKALNYWVFGGFGPNRTPYEFIDFAAEKGLDGVELTVGDCIDVDIDETSCRKISEYAKEKGVGIRTLATGCYGAMSLGAADEAERARAVDFTKKYLQIASWIGAETVLVVPGSACVSWDPSRPVVAYKMVWENSTRSIKELLPLAESLGVTIALENVWMRFLLSPMEWKFFFDQFNSPNLGMYFDVGNCLLYAPAEDYIEVLGKERIKAVHFKNWSGSDCAGGLHGFGASLLEGDIDWKRLLAAFAAIGYEGPFTVEMIPFCRLPDLVLPDLQLAEKVTGELMTMKLSSAKEIRRKK